MRRWLILSTFAVLAITLKFAVASGNESTIDQNKATVRRFYEEVFDTGKADLADPYFTADAIDHEIMAGQKDPAPALPNFKAFLADFRKAFPDLKVQVQDIVGEGDKVVVRCRMTGTHKGNFYGVPATGKSFSVEFIDILRLSNGKFAEHWGIAEESRMMEQLGLTPPPAGATPPPTQPSTK